MTSKSNNLSKPQLPEDILNLPVEKEFETITELSGFIATHKESTDRVLAVHALVFTKLMSLFIDKFEPTDNVESMTERGYLGTLAGMDLYVHYTPDEKSQIRLLRKS